MKDFETKKEEMLQECEEVLKDIGVLTERIYDLKSVLENCNTYDDVFKFYPNDIDVEDGLKHIRLI